jgi:hypothetical protein
MGKRELIIIAAFVVVGTLAYQFTAPPDTSTSSFSLADFFRSARREVRGDLGRGTFVHKATLPVTEGLREVRVIGLNDNIKIVGGDRTTIEYEFSVSSTGSDDAAAAALAKETELTRDEVGDALILRARYPDPGSQRAGVVLHLPSSLAVRVESSRDSQVSGVAAVHLEAMRGDVTLENIAGAITGAHQDGDLTVTGARSTKLRLLRSETKMTQVTDGLVLDLRDADTEISESAGALEIDELRSNLTVAEHRGTITIRGSDGRVTLRRPTAETRVDLRRAEVEVVIATAVPVTIITTDEPLRLILDGKPEFTLDAAAINAGVQASDVELTPEISGSDAKLSHTFGTKGTVKISLRNTRGDVIVRKMSR